MSAEPTSRGLGFSFQSAITVRRLSLIRHSNAPSARMSSFSCHRLRVTGLRLFVMGFVFNWLLFIHSVWWTRLKRTYCWMHSFTSYWQQSSTVFCRLVFSPSCARFCILFYAVFKTVTSLEDEDEREKWLKYWVFYGLFSVICSYLTKGSFIKACVCGILLLKFNVSAALDLHRRTISFCTLRMMWFCPTFWRTLTDTWSSLWTRAPTTFSSSLKSSTGPFSQPLTRAIVGAGDGL